MSKVQEQAQKAKLILAGFAALLIGTILTGMGFAEEPVISGGLWKGPLAIVLGIVLLAVTARSMNPTTVEEAEDSAA